MHIRKKHQVKNVLYRVSNVFPTILHTRLLHQSFAPHRFTTHIYYVLSRKRHDFRRKLLNIKCVLIFSTNFDRNISNLIINWTRYDKIIYICLHVIYPLFLSDFNETCIFSADVQKLWNVNFHENSLNGSRLVPLGRRDSTQTRKIYQSLFAVFRNAPKISCNT
jgi:hypothetical protein